MWEEFQASGHHTPDTGYDAWHFSDSQVVADELAQLTASGRKQATSALLALFTAGGEPLPNIGDYHIITDWEGRAVCIIEMTAVDVLPFDRVGSEHAFLEGEGERSLSYWRSVHRDCFAADARSVGLEFNEQMDVVCMRFVKRFP